MTPSPSVDLPANGADGNLGATRVMRYAPVARGSATQRAVFGDTWVALVEFSTPLRAQVLMSYGNSSMPASPHATDQFPHVCAQTLRPPTSPAQPSKPTPKKSNASSG